jgi:hypothetical protein
VIHLYPGLRLEMIEPLEIPAPGVPGRVPALSASRRRTRPCRPSPSQTLTFPAAQTRDIRGTPEPARGTAIKAAFAIGNGRYVRQSSMRSGATAGNPCRGETRAALT